MWYPLPSAWRASASCSLRSPVPTPAPALVGGYRLVYVKEDKHYFFLFAGTHDDCDRWLNNNKHLKPEPNDAEMSLMVRQAGAVTLSPDHNAPEGDIDYDEFLMQNIDEKMLRRVFRGLCGDL